MGRYPFEAQQELGVIWSESARADSTPFLRSDSGIEPDQLKEDFLGRLQ